MGNPAFGEWEREKKRLSVAIVRKKSISWHKQKLEEESKFSTH